MEYFKKIENQSMEGMPKTDGIGMIQGLRFRYMEMMETLNGTIFFGEGSLLDMLLVERNIYMIFWK